VVRWNDDPERLAARSAAAAAATALPVGRGHARARTAAAALVLPLAVAAVAVAAALPGAVGHTLYGDEVASARIVAEPGATDVLRHVRRTESTPPAWYLVAWPRGRRRELTSSRYGSSRCSSPPRRRR
jgi:hypothetical protein